MKLQFLLVTLALTPSGLLATGEPATPENYIAKYWPLAVEEMLCSGIPASVKLAQALVESRYGTTKLAQEANNHFGVKCRDTWHGPTYGMIDDEKDKKGNDIESCFRSYPTVEASYRDHTDFLLSRNFYSKLFTLPRNAYKKWCRGLKDARYASAPDYDKVLIYYIEKYNLHTYDNMTSADLVAYRNETNPPVMTVPAAGLAIPATPKRDPFAEVSVPVLREDTLMKVFFPNPQTDVFELYGQPCHIVMPGENVERICLQEGISPEEFRMFNDLSPAQEIKPYSYVFMTRKLKKIPCETFIHRIRPGETLHEISQEYCIRLDVLLKDNKIDEGRELPAGAAVWVNGKAPKKQPTISAEEKSAERKNRLLELMVEMGAK